MLGQEVCVDFLALMNRGGIALFDTSLGENTEITTDGQARLNALLVQQFRQAFPRRKDKAARDYDRKKWPPFTLILDEFGDYCSAEFARTLTQASKFGLRCVFAHQNLKQLIGRDGDETLLSAVLAIPNKQVFGNLVDKDAEILAKHMYLAQFNPDEVKYQQDITYWDPEIKEVWLQSYGHTTARGTARGAGGGRGTSIDEETQRIVAQETTSDQSTDTESEGFSDNVQQAYQTFYRKRVEKGPPIFRSVDEQVFKAAQALATSPRGVSVLAREDQPPTVCVVPNMDKRPATLEERDHFTAQLYTISNFGTYLDVAEADKQLEERQRKLLEAAPMIVSSKSPSRRRGASLVATPSEPAPKSPAHTEAPSAVQPPDLVEMYRKLGLPNADRLQRDITGAKKNYASEDWKDSIFNSRNILEGVLREIAEDYSRRNKRPLRHDPSPREVRYYLRDCGLVTEDVWRILQHIYGRQSDQMHVTGEPGRDDAMLWLDQSKALALFVLHRYEAGRGSSGGTPIA
jgi:hypothetical protein